MEHYTDDFARHIGAQQKQRSQMSQALNTSGSYAEAAERGMLEKKSREVGPMLQRDASPVDEALDTLCKVLDGALREVDEMRDRLAPVSSTRPTEERETGQKIPSGCMLEARIEGITNSVNRIATDLSEMRAALRI